MQYHIRSFAFSLSLAALVSTTAMGSVDTRHADNAPTAARVAQKVPAAPVVVYVEDFTVDPRLKQDGAGLASSFCNDLGKDKSLDVVCAPDVQQLMNYAAFRGLAGNSDEGGAPGLTKRLALVSVIVTGEVKQGKHGVISILSVHDRDPTMGDDIVTPAGLRGKVHVKGIANGVAGLTSKFPEFARRVGEIVKRGPSGRAYGSDDLPKAEVVDDRLPKPAVVKEKPAVAD